MPRRPTPALDYELAFWRDNYRAVAGLDEVGRGALAGPVVAAAVILPPLHANDARDWTHHQVFQAIARANDSKLLNENLREKLFAPICELATSVAVGSASVAEIDELNILRASHLAMYRALAALPREPDALLLDALVLRDISIPQQGIIHGDSLSLSIAVASIVAKVSRDRIMRDLDLQYPAYGFARNKGYGTAAHLRALQEHGPTPIHRRSFAPVSQSALDLAN